MHFVIDRRSTKGNSSENRQKFLRRVRHVIKQSMQDTFKNKSIKDIGKDGYDITIDSNEINKTLDEPFLTSDPAEKEQHVIPGNDSFSKGDLIDKPSGSQGQGGKKGSNDPTKSQDPFIIHITEEEFLNFFFEDLELPELTKKNLANITKFQNRNAGFTSHGTPSKLSIVKSMKQSLMRRLALQAGIKNNINQKIALLEKNPDDVSIQNDILYLNERLKKVPYLEELDLKYRNTVKDIKPDTNATMICIMDNSGSMGEREKTLARKFFFLLYMFLNKKYKSVSLIFIHHTTEAREVTEEEFFNMKETGGTLVSPALKLTQDLIKERNLQDTNLYVCQCSDGDNSGMEDNRKCVDILKNGIMPFTQYYAYIQIQPTYDEDFTHNTQSYSLWNAYKELAGKDFAQELIQDEKNIYPVFKTLFEKKHK